MNLLIENQNLLNQIHDYELQKLALVHEPVLFF